MIKLKNIVVLMIFANIVASSVIFAQEIGNKAPDFELKSLSGKNIKISDLKGKILVIDFWASWCAPCRLGIPFLSELYDTYKDKGIEILGINLDNRLDKIEKFIEKLGKKPSFTILWDSLNTVPITYKVTNMPTTFFIDKNGIIIYRHTGFKLEDKEIFKKKIEQMLEK